MSLKFSLEEIQEMGYDLYKLRKNNHKHVPTVGLYLARDMKVRNGKFCKICRVGGDIIDFD